MEFPRRIHMVGIGGIGLSALAQHLFFLGKEVTGSDREASLVTELLRRRGIRISIGHSSEHVPPLTELIIYSPAVPEDNPERAEGRRRGLPELSYPEALGKAAEGKRLIAVSGTHGKTTTTAMIAKILRAAGASPTAVVGSIVLDFESNYLPGAGEFFVAEACEYRRHFYNLSPEILVITNLELDHTDYFTDIDDLSRAFGELARKVPAHGSIIADVSSPAVASALSGVSASVVNYTNERSPSLQLIGGFNEANARAAKAAVRAALPALEEEVMDAALRDFRGTWRRFEYKGTTQKGALVYDDYAHHPTAVRKTLEGARTKFPDANITVVFHPHLYSRTKALLTDFATSFRGAQEVVVAPIYAAREAPDPSISNETLARAIRESGVPARAGESFSSIEALLAGKGAGDVIITMGAGDIYKLADTIAVR